MLHLFILVVKFTYILIQHFLFIQFPFGFYCKISLQFRFILFYFLIERGNSFCGSTCLVWAIMRCSAFIFIRYVEFGIWDFVELVMYVGERQLSSILLETCAFSLSSIILWGTFIKYCSFSSYVLKRCLERKKKNFSINTYTRIK